MLRHCLILLVVFIVGGCQTTRSPATAGQWRIDHREPTIYAVEYHPYGPALTRSLAAPHPNFGGWGRSRMQSDLRDLKRLGIKEIQIIGEAVWLLDNREMAARIPVFIQEAARRAPQLSVVLVADLKHLQPAQLDEFLEFCMGLTLHTYPNYVAIGGTPLIVLRRAGAFPDVRHLGLQFEYQVWDQPPGFGVGELNAERTDIRVTAGAVSTADEWRVPRKNGRTIVTAIRAARQLMPRRLVIRSWNNFADGSFLQRNSLDNNTVYEKTLKALREDVQ
ncbi:MAG: hypothetical protein ACKJSG_12510 [Lentisphaeria bacterium]